MPPGFITAASACAPVIRASRIRFCVIEGIAPFSAFEVREVVLAQRDQDPVVGAREVEPLGGRVVLLDPRLERLGRAVLDQVGEVLDELRGALAAEVVALREREDLLELVEDQQRDQRLAGGVAQHVVAVVQELPQRLAARGRRRLRPLARTPASRGRSPA